MKMVRNIDFFLVAGKVSLVTKSLLYKVFVKILKISGIIAFFYMYYSWIDYTCTIFEYYAECKNTYFNTLALFLLDLDS